MPKVCVLVPFALDEPALANRSAQQRSVREMIRAMALAAARTG